MRPLQVLLADDERIIREGMRKHIGWAAEGLILVDTVQNGQDALDVLKRQPIDILITDIKMPVMDGMQLLEQISLLGINVLVIIVSAHNDFSYTQQAIRSQIVYDYILKPLDIAEFLTLLREACAFWRNRMEGVGGSALFRGDPVRFAQEQFVLDSMVQNQIVEQIQKGAIAQAQELVRAAWRDEQRAQRDYEYFSRFTWELTMKMSWMLTNRNQVPLSIYQLHDPMKELAALTRREELEAYCCRLIQDCQEWQGGHKTPTACVQACLNIITRQYADPTLSMQALSQQIMMSANYLSSQFKRDMGAGFPRYLNTYRIEKSKELLRDVSYKTYEISDRVGFEDPRYFSRLFKELVGMTPTEYRKNYTAKERRTEHE